MKAMPGMKLIDVPISKPEFEGSSSEDVMSDAADGEETTSKLSSSIFVKQEKMEKEEEKETVVDFDVDDILMSTNEQHDTSEANSSGNSMLLKAVCISNNTFPIQFVSCTFSVSRLRNTKFTWRNLFKNVLTSEKNCVRWLAAQGLIHNERTCVKCVDAMYLTRDETIWRCRRCGSELSIRQDTFFQEKRFPHTTILELMYWWTLDAKYELVQREVGILGRPAVSFWFRYCRQLCEQYYLDHPCVLGGPGRVIEVEALQFRSYQKLPHQFVLGMVDRESKNAFLTVLSNNHLRTIVDFIEEVVQPGSEVVSSAASSYRKLCSRSDLHFSGPEEVGFSTDAVSRVFGDVQEIVRRKSGIRRDYFEAQLKEIMFRELTGDRLFGELLYWVDFYRW